MYQYNEGLIFCYVMHSSINKKNMNTLKEKGEEVLIGNSPKEKFKQLRNILFFFFLTRQ